MIASVCSVNTTITLLDKLVIFLNTEELFDKLSSKGEQHGLLNSFSLESINHVSNKICLCTQQCHRDLDRDFDDCKIGIHPNSLFLIISPEIISLKTQGVI